MPNPLWPQSLPPIQQVETAKQVVDNRMRSETDSGIPKMRRRFTATLKLTVFPFVMDNRQVEAFEYFWETTTEGGTLPFDWYDPVQDKLVSYQFGQTIPVFRLFSGGDKVQRKWITEIEMEQLP